MKKNFIVNIARFFALAIYGILMAVIVLAGRIVEKSNQDIKER
jgi:hypothetical protein